MYKTFDDIILRNPFYPVEVIKKALEEESYFKEIITSETFRQAIFFASPVLYEEIDKYVNKQQKEKDRIRTRNSLVRYLSRMSTRCTPFGLFATCSTGKTGEKSEIVLSDDFKTHIRFDMLYLCNLAQQLEGMKEIRQVAKYYMNSTVYASGDKLRYIEYRFNTQQRMYQLVEIKKNSYLTFILNKAKAGIYYQELIDMLVNEGEVPEETAINYINRIIDNQLLVSEIDPIVTGSDFFNHITEVIEKTDHDSETYQRLNTLKILLGKLNTKIGNQETVEICNEIEEEIKKLSIPYQKSFLLQVDTIRETKKFSLSKEIINEIQQGIEFLNKVSPSNGNPGLNDFKKAFMERYEDQEVPLLEALDPELGIGYPANQVNDSSPLLVGLALPQPQGNTSQQMVVTPLNQILQKKIMDFNAEKDKEIVIKKEDVGSLPAQWDNIPATMGSKFEVINDPDNPDEYRIKLDTFSGTSAANLLGRFAYCDNSIAKLVRDITQKEKETYKDYIVAEIAHIPDSRVGNILARPTIRDYEILYLANTTLSRENVIYASDIMISLRQNHIFLRSKILDKYILPRLTTAHNYHSNPTPIYRFLCELQGQGLRPALYFTWGGLDQQHHYLPRVCYEKLILSMAKWKITVKDMESFIEEKNEEKLMKGVNKWKEKLNLPRYLTLVDGDNTLFVDLENIYSLQSFFSVIKKRPQIILEEFLESSPDFVKDCDGKGYANEFIISFYKETKE